MNARFVPFLLQFEEQITQVQSAISKSDSLLGADVAVRLSLPVGAGALARDVLRHTPPRPLEIEHAIEVVEEAIMPARAQLPGVFQLFSADPLLCALAAEVPGAPEVMRQSRAGLPDEARWLGMDAVEKLFSRLVARTEGRPASQDELPVDGASAARLVIVREILHHWGLDGLYVNAL